MIMSHLSMYSRPYTTCCTLRPSLSSCRVTRLVWLWRFWKPA